MTGAEDNAREDGMNLTEEEADALAKRVMARHLVDTDWLLWEDLPELGEHAFDRLEAAVKVWAQAMSDSADLDDKRTGIDSLDLLDRAQ